MKNTINTILKQTFLFGFFVFALVPAFAFASGDEYDYYGGGYTTYDDYSSYSGGGYTTYDNSYSGSGYTTYDDYSSYSGGGYTTYDDSYYGGGYTTYDDSYYGGGYTTYDDSYYGGGYTTYDDTYYGGGYATYNDNTPVYSNPIIYTDSNQIVYQEPYYEEPYYQEPYYEEPYYQEPWYPNYVTYNDNYIDYGYYGDTGCNRNCGGDTVVIVPPTNDLDVVCYVSDRTIEEGDSVTFEAEVDGGKGPYTYRWTGDITSNNRTTTVRFDDYGTYEGRVRVTDSKGRTATANCDVVVERDDRDDDDEDFDAVCKVSDRTIEEGDRVTFTADVDGGDRPYDYDWSGDADQDSQSFSMKFNRSGRYTINLKVTDDEGRIARDTCEVRVEDDNNNNDDDDDDRDINISTGTLSSGGGTFASVGSVYLNQVPYTGPEDVAKGVAFVSLLLAWSVAGAMIVRKRVIKNKIAKRIADFKESNKLAKI